MTVRMVVPARPSAERYFVDADLAARGSPLQADIDATVTTTANKELVRRLIDDAVNERNLDVVDELADGELAAAAKRWIGPFRASFPDFTMKIIDLVAEGDTVVGYFQCSGTHHGEWNGIQATGKRFQDVDEIYIFHVRDGKLTGFVAVEDNLSRLRQLGFEIRPA
jgi:predicted ester cyclase